MPAIGLPDNLQLMLDTILEHRSLKSWQIYEERGGMTVKIRFSPSARGQDGSVPEQGMKCAYTKKSPSHMRRDKNRISAFNEHRRVTRSMDKNDDSSVEKPRNDDSDKSIDMPIFSPPHVETDTPQVNDSLHEPIMDTSPECQSIPVKPIDLNNSLAESTINNSVCDQQTETQQTNMNSHDLHDSDGCETDDDVESDPIIPPGCFNNECSYGGGQNTGIRLYECMKCVGIDVCEECYVEGTAHMGHRKYLKIKK